MAKASDIDGAFLVHPSKVNLRDDIVTIFNKRDNTCAHVKIRHVVGANEFYDLYGGAKFTTLSELVGYYHENPKQLKSRDRAANALKWPLLCERVTSARWAAQHVLVVLEAGVRVPLSHVPYR
eukprot:m.114230 g.114230  ORF g.114230 m.114230 type:complete len:123 (+) comp21505_c0_seq10:3796-4164(+)